MKYSFLLIALFSIVAADKWALFVSGNNGYYNYCITSTICRGYDILHRAGVPEDHMVYLGFNDVFDSSSNPFPGQIFTDESEGPGVDYAAECRPHIDYPDKMVSAELFMSVLSGDKETTTKLTGVQNPKVIESTAEDTVFVYYMDHGAIGFCEVGKSDLQEQVLMDTINKMFDNHQYKQMVFYFEACHSGSMFRKLESTKNVYAMTGSDTEHSAWMCNCPPHDKVNGKSMGTCLSAWYDNFWMQEVMDNGSKITLSDMFTHVHEETAKETDQNVSQFGDIEKMGPETLDTFIGDYKPEYSTPSERKGYVPYEDVPMHLAKWNAIRSQNANSLAELQEVVKKEAVKEISVMRLARAYFKDDKLADQATKSRPATYNQDCVKDLTLSLMAKCGYTLPLRDSHVNALENICFGGMVEVDFDQVC
ncbi:hypothetical protein WA538_003974 [Blastocystis sp. DL]